MRLLLDTHVIVWLALSPERLSSTMASLIRDEANQLIFSSLSIWEIAIKRALGRSDFAIDPVESRDDLIRLGVSELEFGSRHALAVADLPPIHQDPFDRGLIAQCRADGLHLLTDDAKIRQYSTLVQLAG